MSLDKFCRDALASAIALPVAESAADLTVQISLATADALEVSYELPENCTRLTFEGSGASPYFHAADIERVPSGLDESLK